MKTTNVKASDLNYDHYATDKYDRDIINSIPHHQDLHEAIIKFVRKNYSKTDRYSVIDLGVGTGITSKIIKDELPNAEFDLVDFSQKMLNGAKKKMGTSGVRYIFTDYASMKLDRKYDIVVSVIGIHHQNHKGKKLLFKKIYSMLKPGGVFIFGDLVTHKNPKKASLNQALHFHHLVNKSTDKKTLEEWAHHHYVLNDLAPVEDQVEWLKAIGLSVKVEMLEMNTGLLICKK